MSLIDWAGLARNALWIMGLSVLLGTLSFAHWRAGQDGIRWRTMLGQPAYQALLSLGLLLFAAGLAWGATRLWERLAWWVLLAAFFWQLVAALLAHRKANGGQFTRE